MKVFIVSSSPEYASMFVSLGYTISKNLAEADVVCFTGGSDVSPKFYGEDRHPETYNDLYRDELETSIYNCAKKKGKLMVGICRGGQFLHVMNGGRLWQHVDNHATGRPHVLTDRTTKRVVGVTSTHHQMMRKALKDSGMVVATANESVRKEWMQDGELKNTLATDTDIEVMWYEHSKCLCFQPHPEFDWAIEGAESTYLYFKNLLARYIGGIYEG